MAPSPSAEACPSRDKGLGFRVELLTLRGQVPKKVGVLGITDTTESMEIGAYRPTTWVLGPKSSTLNPKVSV